MRWPAPVAHCSRTTGGAVKTTTPSGVSVTVLAKVVLNLLHGEATLAPPQPLVLRDAHEDDDAERSVVRPAETAPRLLQPEVVVVRCTARQPVGQQATTRAVALAIYREQTPLLTKMIHVYGDRPVANPQAVKPFAEMPVTWALSRFEPSVNPFGVRPNESRMPNVVAPQHPNAPASLEPLARRTPWRKGLLGSVAAATADGVEPSLPADFNWEYYQCATRDQRFAGVAGGEWLVLDGVSAEHPRIQCRLPVLKARARVHRRGVDTPTEVPLTFDLVVVDARAMTVSLIARGHAPWSEGMSVSVTLEGTNVPAEWPAPVDAPPPSQQPKLAYAGTAAANAAPTQETANLSEEGQKEAAAQKTAPFEIAAPKAPSASAPGPAPWKEAAQPVVPAAIATPMGTIGTSKRTMAISADALRPPVAEAPAGAPPPLPAPPPVPAPKPQTIGERFASGEKPKPAPEPPPPIVSAKPIVAAPPPSVRASASKVPAPVERFGVKRPAEEKKPLDKSPEAVAERMWKSGVSKADIEAYLASVKR